LRHYRLIRLLLATAIALMAVGVWASGRIQQSADDAVTRLVDSGQRMLIAMLDQETGLRGYINTRREAFLQPYERGPQQLDARIGDARADSQDAQDTELIERQVRLARRWQALAEAQIDHIRDGEAASGVAAARGRKAIMDRFRAANAAFVAHLEDDRSDEQGAARRTAVLVVVALGLMFAILGWAAVERPMRREARRRRRLGDFSDALQVARSETEAFNVLRRHLEGWLRSARATVLMRNPSANRLQAATGLEDVPRLAEKLDGAAPEACMAVRLARPHLRAPDDKALLVCPLCGELPSCSACVPTIVGGEVVGSVVVQTSRPLDSHDLEDLQSSVAGAGPVIANLRNLAIAELRAATDSLTGLPNHRAIQDTLNRMVAQAGRSKTLLAAVLFDLDHFKQVNDIHGHAKGDEVLAAVGAAVAETIRDSDFPGRYGGEEFVLLLPETGLDGALVLAEKVRATIEALDVEGLDRRVSASFGVAVLPDDAATGEQLLRAADRALYAAKNAGRNRVESVR
jgi:diguanylate cyclase (GGDEF)-like protein